MHQLILHPDCAPGPITAVMANIEPIDDGFRARFRLRGDLARIKVPENAPSERTDYVWQTTCFEVFWQPLSGEFYREFNLSPSRQWACYDFDEFRQGSRDGPVSAVSIASSRTPGELVLEASVASPLELPAKVALNAVVEGHDGRIQYWALAFPPGRPEFHAVDNRIVIVGDAQ